MSDTRWIDVTIVGGNYEVQFDAEGRYGRTQCLKDWCAELGMKYRTVMWRCRHGGWPIGAALTLKGA